MSTTKITKAQFIKNYKEAEKRALATGPGLSFQTADRVVLNAQRKQLGLDIAMAANLVGSDDYNKHYNRFDLWDRQIRGGVVRTAPLATGEYVAVGSPVTIKKREDIQPTFNRVAQDLIKVGITNLTEAERFLAVGFEHAKVEQKIYVKTARIVSELQLGDLSREQAVTVLKRAKAAL